MKLVVLHKGRAYDIELSDDATVQELKERMQEATGVPIEKQKMPGVLSMKVKNEMKVNDVPAFFKKPTLTLMGKANPKLKATDQQPISIPEAKQQIENLLQNENLGTDPAVAARIYTAILSIEESLNQDKSCGSSELRMVLQRCSTINSTITAKVSYLLRLMPGDASEDEFELFINNMMDMYEEQGKLAPSMNSQMRTYAKKMPSCFTAEHVDFLFSMDDISRLKLTTSIDAIMANNPSAFVHKIPELVSIAKKSMQSGPLAVRSLLAIAKKEPQLLVPYIADVFHLVDESHDDNTRFLHGPNLIVAVSRTYEEIQSSTMSLLFDLVPSCPDKFLLYVLYDIMVTASYDSSLLRPYAPKIVLLQHHDELKVRNFATKLWKLTQEQESNAIDELIGISNDTEASDAVLEKLEQVLKRIDVVEELTVDAKKQAAEAAEEMSKVEGKLTSWRDTVDSFESRMQAQESETEKLCALAETQEQAIKQIEVDVAEQQRALEQGLQELQSYVDQNMANMKEFVSQLVKKLPIPISFSTEGSIRKSVLLHFVCGKRTPDCCIHDFNDTFSTSTTEWNKWLKIGVSALMLGKSLVAKSPLEAFGNIKKIYTDFKKRDDDDFTKFTQEPFLTSHEQDKLIIQLRKSDFYEHFSYDAQIGDWVCSGCRPTKSESVQVVLPEPTHEVEPEQTQANSFQVTTESVAEPETREDVLIPKTNEEQSISMPAPVKSITQLASEGNIEQTEEILKFGVNVNTQDASKRTGLHYAVLQGNKELIQLFLSHGANPCILDNRGRVAFLQDGVDPEIRDYLLTKLARPGPFVLDSASPNCLLCYKRFSTFTRRHHCRHCGLLVCSACSAHKVAIRSFKHYSPVRICSLCLIPVRQANK